MAQCQGPRAQIRLFFGLHLYLAGKYCENHKMPGVQLNVTPARAITWFVGVTIYCTFFNNNSPLPRQFLCNKILLKKLATARGMLIQQIFELRGHGPPGRICSPKTGCFHDKTIISKKNIRLDYLLLKYCRRECSLLPPTSSTEPPREGAGGTMTPGPMEFEGPMGFRRAHELERSPSKFR